MLTFKKRFFIKKKIKGIYNLDDSLFLLKKYSIFNFDESVDLSIKLSSNFLKSNKVLKDFLYFPNNYFKFTKILILVDGFLEYFFRNLGYLYVGLFNLNFINSNNHFDFLVTTEKFKNYIYVLDNFNYKKILIINCDLYKFLLNMNYYKSDFKSSKHGNLNLSLGRVSFSLNFLKENFLYFFNYLKKIKKNFLKYKLLIDKVFFSSTMGVSFRVKFNNKFLF